MSREFKNNFSWSKSRDELFRECHRKYYYDKYGFWGGWRSDADPAVREIYLLKQVKSSRMWMGSAVHDAVERALKGFRDGRKVSQDEVISGMTDRMRTDYKLSRTGRYVSDPKHACALFEHVYSIEMSQERWKQLHATACSCIDHFFKSALLERAFRAGTASWLPIEEMQSFSFEGTTVYVKLDFAFREGRQIVVIDWKTGRGEDVDVTVQLGCYALYATQRWNVRPEDVQAIEFNLNTLKENTFNIIEARLEWARHYMRNSIQGMRKALADPEQNEAHMDAFDKTDDRRKCRWCNYRRICLPDLTF